MENQAEINRKKILEKNLKRGIDVEREKISESQTQNRTKERVQKSIEEKAAQLAKMEKRTSGLKNSLNSSKPLDGLQEKKSSKIRRYPF